MSANQPLHIAMIGAGRIAQIHAATVNSLDGVSISAVVDVNDEAANALATLCNAVVVSIDDVFADSTIDAVIIASSTDTHADLLDSCADSGKAVFCEKPIDLDLQRARETAEHVAASGICCALGFNRRFDPQFQRLRETLQSGAIGTLESLIIISRDPAPPPVEYINRSGGLFRDMTIHDFDMARWLLGEEISHVSAAASNLVDPDIGAAGDVDTAAITLRSVSGKLVNIHNSRRAVYGYDQRIEAFGSEGMLQAQNIAESPLIHSGDKGVCGEKPQYFFLERYADAFRIELEHFVACLRDGHKPQATQHDGVAALQLAEGAVQALKNNVTIALSDI